MADHNVDVYAQYIYQDLMVKNQSDVMLSTNTKKPKQNKTEKVENQLTVG